MMPGDRREFGELLTRMLYGYNPNLTGDKVQYLLDVYWIALEECLLGDVINEVKRAIRSEEKLPTPAALRSRIKVLEDARYIAPPPDPTPRGVPCPPEIKRRVEAALQAVCHDR